MALIDQKKQIMGKVGALNTIVDGLPNLKTTNSTSSINNNGNSTDFLIDLVKYLIGYEELKENVVDILTRKLSEIESAIKKDLKKELKELVSCSVNPNVPDWFRSDSNGVVLKMDKIDFFDITKTNPESAFGSLLYDDTTSGENSTDFNTFLYSNISKNKNVAAANAGLVSSWGLSTSNSDIMNVAYSPVGATENTVVKFTTSVDYDNKKLTDFNNDFIDSVNLFGSDKMINNIMDSLFGSISFSLNKSKKQLTLEAEIQQVLTCILDADEDDVIDDNYFTFTNEQLAQIESDVDNKKKGVMLLEACNELPVQVPVSLLLSSQEAITAAKTNPNGLSVEEAEVNAVEQTIDTLAAFQASFAVNAVDVPTIEANFILDIIRKFMTSIINLVISPKLISIFAINHQIIYGQGTSYANAIDFMKKNKNLVKTIANTIRDFIIKMLLVLALKYISVKLSQKFSEDEIEKGKNYVSQLLSLTGVPPQIIREIQGIEYIGA
jgi:hypothetical protein